MLGEDYGDMVCFNLRAWTSIIAKLKAEPVYTDIIFLHGPRHLYLNALVVSKLAREDECQVHFEENPVTFRIDYWTRLPQQVSVLP